MEISERVGRAGVSATIRLSEKARQLRENGREIIDLAEGEPDFDTPSHITYAAFEAAKGGATRYTDVAGTAELRDAVARQFKRLNGLNVESNNVIVGTGAKQLIFNALMCTVNPGDEVVIPTPCWVSYADMVRICDGVPVLGRCSADAGFKLTAGLLEELITPRTRCLILNSPCNPTGVVYSRDELSALAVVLRKHPGVAVVCDDIYQEIVFGGVSFTTLAAVAPELSDRILTVHGVSKTYAMTGVAHRIRGGSVRPHCGDDQTAGSVDDQRLFRRPGGNARRARRTAGLPRRMACRLPRAARSGRGAAGRRYRAPTLCPQRRVLSLRRLLGALELGEA